jgi:hypothetical protein
VRTETRFGHGAARHQVEQRVRLVLGDYLPRWQAPVGRASALWHQLEPQVMEQPVAWCALEFLGEFSACPGRSPEVVMVRGVALTEVVEALKELRQSFTVERDLHRL